VRREEREPPLARPSEPSVDGGVNRELGSRRLARRDGGETAGEDEGREGAAYRVRRKRRGTLRKEEVNRGKGGRGEKRRSRWKCERRRKTA
jgi:hypothetical protein